MNKGILLLMSCQCIDNNFYYGKMNDSDKELLLRNSFHAVKRLEEIKKKMGSDDKTDNKEDISSK